MAAFAHYLAAGIIIMVALCHGSLYDSTASKELERVKEQVKIIHDMLHAENCPDPELTVGRRDLLRSRSVEDEVRIEVQRRLYEKLVDMLVNCRGIKAGNTVTVVPTRRTSKTYSSYPSTPSTAPSMIPSDDNVTELCQNALNFTEWWRKDSNGSNIRPRDQSYQDFVHDNSTNNYNCDTRDLQRMGRPWFRFSGDAGNRILNNCAPSYSCGSVATYWSDYEMPAEVGIIKPIKFHTSYTDRGRHYCHSYSPPGKVMRCSQTADDFIYTYDVNIGECVSFCGM